MSYLVHLQQFEGPLGLLLYLIRKEEMDIFDINVNEITHQYLEYIRMMKELDLELAGEFVAMAATLIHIKSRMLLPQYNEEGEVVDQEDPRKELVQKLLEYQRYQEAAKQLYDRPLLGRDVFSRGLRTDFRTDEELGEIIIEDDGLFSLISAYRRTVRKALKAVHNVRPRVQSIAMRVMEIKERLTVGTRVVLRDLLNVGTASCRAQLLVTFLSLLELGRMGYVSLFQNEVYGDIYIDTITAIERNVLERVQEFDAGDAEAVARSIINEAVEEKIDLKEATNEDQLDLLAASDQTLSASGADAQLDFVEGLGAGLGIEEMNIDVASDDDILAAEAELGVDDIHLAIEPVALQDHDDILAIEPPLTEVHRPPEADADFGLVVNEPGTDLDQV